MLSSYVVSQGKWVYYYSSDEIMKMDENKNIYTVLSVSDIIIFIIWETAMQRLTCIELHLMERIGCSYTKI